MKGTIFLYMVVIFSLAVPLWAQTAEDLREELKKLVEKRENIESEYLRKKYKYIEIRQKGRDEISRLDVTIKDLVGKKNRLREDIHGVKREAEGTKEEADLLARREFNLSEIISSTAKKLEEQLKAAFPMVPPEYPMALGEIKKGGGNKEKILARGRKLVEVMKSIIAFTESSEIKRDDIVLPSGEIKKGKRVRIGGVFYGYITDESSEGGVLLRSGGIGADTFKWFPLGGGEKDLIEEFPSAIEEKGGTAMLPLDVMQSRITSRSMEAGDSFFAGFVHWFNSGGLVMYVITVVFFFGMYIIVERALFFRKERVYDDNIFEPVMSHVKNGNVDGAVRACREGEGILHRVLGALLSDRGATMDDAYNRINEVLLHEMPGVEKNLATLKSLAALAPLLGLLGTVTGMISLFDVITTIGTADPKLLAGGISEALVTTEFGLIVAIPAMMSYRFLQNRADFLINEIERCSLSVVHQIWKTGPAKKKSAGRKRKKND